MSAWCGWCRRLAREVSGCNLGSSEYPAVSYGCLSHGAAATGVHPSTLACGAVPCGICRGLGVCAVLSDAWTSVRAVRAPGGRRRGHRRLLAAAPRARVHVHGVLSAIYHTSMSRLRLPIHPFGIQLHAVGAWALLDKMIPVYGDGNGHSRRPRSLGSVSSSGVLPEGRAHALPSSLEVHRLLRPCCMLALLLVQRQRGDSCCGSLLAC